MRSFYSAALLLLACLVTWIHTYPGSKPACTGQIIITACEMLSKGRCSKSYYGGGLGSTRQCKWESSSSLCEASGERCED